MVGVDAGFPVDFCCMAIFDVDFLVQFGFVVAWQYQCLPMQSNSIPLLAWATVRLHVVGAGVMPFLPVATEFLVACAEG